MATTAPVAVASRSSRRRPSPKQVHRLQGVAGVLILLALLQLATAVGILPERSFPYITDDFSALVQRLGEGEFWSAVGNTLQGWAIGFGIATVVGVVLGVLLGSSDVLFSATRAIVEFLRPIPSVALIPLAVLVYGTGLQSKVFLAAFAATWPILVQATYGVRDVDPVAVDTARAFGFGRFARIRTITVPSAVPYIATGLRIASATALILVVTAELVIGAPGLGQEINIARSGGNFEAMYALIITSGMLGWGLNVAFTQLERRMLHWHPSQRLSEGGA